MNTPQLAVKHQLLNQIALAVIAALTLLCTQAKAQIAVVDSDYMTMSYQGGITSAAFSQPATVSPGAGVLVVVLANNGAGRISAEPTQLFWQGQTVKKVVSIDNVNSVYGNVTIYCLSKPIAGTGNITGAYAAIPTDNWVSLFTLVGASTVTAPLTGTANNANNTTLTFNVPNILDGSFAVVCGIWSEAGGSGLDLQASRGAMNPQYDSTDDNTAAAMGTVSGLSAGAASFTYSVSASGGAAKMAFAGAVFYPVSSAPLSAANSAITASPAALPANGASTATITVQAVDTSGVGMEGSAGTATLQTTAGTLSSVTDNLDGSYTAILTSPTITSPSSPATASITGTVNGSVIGHPASVVFTPQSFSPGFLKLEVYLNAPGSTVTDLLAFANYPSFPDEVHYVPLFEIPPAKYILGNSGGIALGERLSGFIVPAETANYVFYLSANEAGQLWLSTNADPAGLQLIAQGYDDYPALTYDTNCSAPIHLVAGQRYYVQAVEKSNGSASNGAGGEGEESMAVTWTKQNEPPPAYQTAPISGQFLATFTDADTTPPAAVTNLVIDPNTVGVSWLWAQWTSPSEPGNTNPVAYYDLRYSTQTITSNNWASATPADTTFFFGQPAGTAQKFKVTGLNQSTTYHFAIRSTDAAGNVSELSNVAVGTTLAVSLGSFNVLWDLEFNVAGADPTAAGDWRNRPGSLPAGTTWANIVTNGWLTCLAWNPILDTVPKNDFNYPFIVEERCQCLNVVNMSGTGLNGANFFINMDYRSDGQFSKFSFALGLTADGTQELNFVNWTPDTSTALLLTNYTGLSADFHVIRVAVDTANTQFTVFIDSTNMGTLTYFRVPTASDVDAYATILGWAATAQFDYIRIGTPLAPPPPQLNITRTGSSVAISWPTNATGFTLQTTASLAPTSWSNAGNPVVQGDQNVFTTMATNAARFYRLKQ